MTYQNWRTCDLRGLSRESLALELLAARREYAALETRAKDGGLIHDESHVFPTPKSATITPWPAWIGGVPYAVVADYQHCGEGDV